MAMNNANYGYPSTSGFSSSLSSPYSSTPTAVRGQRPSRFAYSGPSLYPRPRSSASKPNPDSFSDSMINNYGNSTSLDISFPSENENSYNSSFRSPNSNSSYYSCNDTYYGSSDQPYQRGSTDNNSYLLGSIDNNSYLRDTPQQYPPAPKYSYNNNTATYPVSDGADMKGRFQKSPQTGFSQMESYTSSLKRLVQDFKPTLPAVPLSKKFPPRKFGKAKRNMSEKPSTGIRCDLCSLDFTSQVPYEMHLRGAKHAKKLKAKDAMQTIQKTAKDIDAQGKQFKCEVCNVTANSSLQLQTHLDGNKHKSKILALQQPKTDGKADESVPKTETESQVNGKSNGAVIRSLPSDFGEPQPAKIAKFSCDLCNIVVNSDTQLQQHLTSKKHQAKVEGKPLQKGKKNKKKEGDADASDSNASAVGDTVQESNDTSKTVMGVKTLTSSFVQGETLH